MKRIARCKHCGSKDVVADAWVEWDEFTNDWKIYDVFDEEYCRNCEACGDVIEKVEVPDTTGVTQHDTITP